MSKLHNYIVTHSGRMVSVESGVPSLEDLALSMSRQPRFGGMTRRWWSVLDHSLFVAALAQKDDAPAALQLALLLHDAHEFTGDIPTHFKHAGQRVIQGLLDARIFGEYAGAVDRFQLSVDLRVKDYDNRALLAEALVVGPPAFVFTQDVVEHFGQKPRLSDVIALDVRIKNGTLGVHPSELAYGLEAKNVRHFLSWIKTLQGGSGVRSSDGTSV